MAGRLLDRRRRGQRRAGRGEPRAARLAAATEPTGRLHEAQPPGGEVARDLAQPGQDSRASGAGRLAPARVGHAHAQGPALEGHDLGAARQLGAHRGGPGRPQERERLLPVRRRAARARVPRDRSLAGTPSYSTLYWRAARASRVRHDALAPMQCPRCRNPITTVPDPGGFLICPGCGARLTATRTRRARGAGHPERPPPGAAPPPPRPRPRDVEPCSPPAAPPEYAARRRSRGPASPVAAPPRAGVSSRSCGRAGLETPASALLEEIRALREAAGRDPARSLREPATARRRRRASGRTTRLLPSSPPVRSPAAEDRRDHRRRCRDARGRWPRSSGGRPRRAVADGQRRLAAIAEEKPDVIALELAPGGSMGGKDVINMIKATMEWVDIPIILYTRGRWRARGRRARSTARTTSC